MSPGSTIDVPSRTGSVAGPAERLPRPDLYAAAQSTARARIRGKFLFLGDSKFYVRGVTYGTFRPDANGHLFPDAEVVEHDLATMVSHGVNTLRTFTVPPRWVLDAASRHGLRVLVGLAWEQHITFLDDRQRVRDIERRGRLGVRATRDHPAVLGYLVGNEIPSSIVRWHGRRRVEHLIERLYAAAKDESPDSLVSYGNYPTTEYLNLSFLDFVAFNVYLEQESELQAYLSRLQNIAGDRPLLLTELGADSRRLGEDRQAAMLDGQIRMAYAGGCAGVCVFAWTDEWHRGGVDIEDWEFGLVDRERRAKPALSAVREAFVAVPFPSDVDWPRMSVVVCSYNGNRTIRDCLDGLRQLEYADFEVIVVDDGSTDGTADIAREYGCRLVSTENRGLSSARNVGMSMASGEIVAFIDDDARPDPHWLQYLAMTFMGSTHAGAGGPNIAPDGDGWVAECVANAPGGPMHVLLSDQEAEHIPGCNMAIRKASLQAVGGFDPQFRVAGDDVDLCWRLQQQGWTLGFSPAAMVWHHRRGSVDKYWKQQVGYGRAEALLERKWPEKYNSVGHLTWQGRLYGRGLTRSLGWWQRRIYHGTWGSAPYQSVYSPTEEGLWSVPLMPEWYLLCIALAGLGSLGAVWAPLRLAVGLLIAAISASVVQAGVSAAHASLSSTTSRLQRAKLRAFILLLHLLQPAARLVGRLRHGLTPWRERRRERFFLLPWPRRLAVWNAEGWCPPEAWLGTVETALRAHRVRVVRGGAYDEWDLEVRSGLVGAARMRMAIEEHGQGRQLVRFRTWPRCAPVRLAPIVFLAGLSAAAARDGAQAATAVLGALAIALTLYAFDGCCVATAAVLRALPHDSGTPGTPSG